MIKKWKFINRDLLLDHPRMKIVEDSVELPTGKITSYIREAPASHSSVTIIAINDKDEILIQSEYSYPPNEVMYQLPGGKMDINEDILTAANRELSEESGYIAKDCTILGSFYVNNRRSDAKQHVVMGRNIEAKNSQEDEEEFIESQWVSMDTIKEMVQTGKIVNMNMLAALQLYCSFEK